MRNYRLRLGMAIRNTRLSCDVSQQLLAQMVGTSKAHIWRVESGNVGPSIDMLVRIAIALDVKVKELIEF